MNRKAIKYIVTSLVVVGCLSTISKTTMANTISYSINSLESSIDYADNNMKIKMIKKINIKDLIYLVKKILNIFLLIKKKIY